MSRGLSKQFLAFIILFAVMVCAAVGAHFVDNDFGNIKVEKVRIPVASGEITAKIYIPKEATEANPAPAILCIHGYQNDKETSVGWLAADMSQWLLMRMDMAALP